MLDVLRTTRSENEYFRIEYKHNPAQNAGTPLATCDLGEKPI